MEQKIVIRYSMSFQRQVVSELENGRFESIAEARAHYGINGCDTVQRWLARYGRQNLCAKVVKVQKPDEKDQIAELRKENRQLQQALGQTQAENILNKAFLKIACERIGQDVDEFKKKHDIGQSMTRRHPKK